MYWPKSKDGNTIQGVLELKMIKIPMQYTFIGHMLRRIINTNNF